MLINTKPVLSRTLFFIALFFLLSLHGQQMRIVVVDSLSNEPVVNARVQVEGTSFCAYTNLSGRLEIELDQLNEFTKELQLPDIYFHNSDFVFEHFLESNIAVFNSAGYVLYKANGSSHSVSFEGLAQGVYLILIEHQGVRICLKSVFLNNKLHGNPKLIWRNKLINLQIEKDGFKTRNKSAVVLDDMRIELVPLALSQKDYLTTIDRKDDFEEMSAIPRNPYFGEVKSLKFIYEIDTKRIFYVNSKVFTRHSYFSMEVLGYPKGNTDFINEQYHNNPNRLYCPGTIEYFESSDRFVLQFFAVDDISCTAIREVYELIKETCYFGDQLYFYANAVRMQNCLGMRIVTSEELYDGQNYQCLNPEESYGYLRFINLEQMNASESGRHDLVVLNGIPIDLPPVAGIITTEFQTPLSHLNVLSINRKTPNMVLRDVWNNPDIKQFEDKLVYLNANYVNYELREAKISEAQQFWDDREPKSPIELKPDTLESQFIELDELLLRKAIVIGAKAANFGELSRALSNEVRIPMPEEAFAIPFYYYCQHLRANGLYDVIKELLSDEDFNTDISLRKLRLAALRDLIKEAPLDKDFLSRLEERLGSGAYKRYRFRSSTNAEDIDGFNGAGLYDSKSAIPGNSDKTIEEAVKKVWASTWNFKAFEERAFFKIDHNSVCMGILVHRSFADEKANGVLITKNIYRDGLPAFTINCQYDEISVVNPEGNWMAEQLLYYTFKFSNESPINYLNYSNVPGHQNQTVLTDGELHNLYVYTTTIVDHYKNLGFDKPLDIEFKIDLDKQGKRVVYIKQCRVFND